MELAEIVSPKSVLIHLKKLSDLYPKELQSDNYLGLHCYRVLDKVVYLKIIFISHRNHML